jgi:transposase InsO family protein
MVVGRFGLSERRACQITGQHRSTQRHRLLGGGDRDDALRERLRVISREHPRWGYRLAWGVVREEGWEVNRKKIQRLWREEGLRVPRRKRKRGRLGESTVPAAWLRSERPNHVWALDFQFDTTTDGRTLKLG